MPKLNSKPLTEDQIKSISLISQEANRSLIKMVEPLKQANEKLVKALNSGLSLQVKAIAEQFSKMPVPAFNEIFPKIDLPTPSFYPPISKETAAPLRNRTDYILDKQDQLLEMLMEMDLSNSNQEPYRYYSETDTFIVNLRIPGAIYLGAKGKNNSMKILFEIFYGALEERGEVKNGYKTVFVLVEEILRKALQKGKKDVDMDWLKHTRSNLVNTKIPDILKLVIIISEYDKSKKGYHFKVRVD